MLDPLVDVDRDHVLGPLDAEMTLVEYGSYACPRCHAVHEIIEGLRSRFGDRMRYVCFGTSRWPATRSRCAPPRWRSTQPIPPDGSRKFTRR